MASTTQSDIELVASLHSSDETAHENADNTTELLFVVLVTAAAVGTLNNIVISVLKMTFHTHYRHDRQKFKKIAYQMTNLTVNLCLGLYGILHHTSTVPRISEVPIIERITGFPEYAYFGAIQVGYNAWALPFGYYWMNESKAMIGHHIAVLCVASISTFCTNGFRYHAPFFFGLIEISSVPLSIMNFCRDNQDLTSKHIPKLGALARPIFAVTFLVVRVFMWTPLIADVLWMSGLLGWTCEQLTCKVGIGAFSLSATFLTLLQFYWATLILKSICKALVPGDSKLKAE